MTNCWPHFTRCTTFSSFFLCIRVGTFEETSGIPSYNLLRNLTLSANLCHYGEIIPFETVWIRQCMYEGQNSSRKEQPKTNAEYLPCGISDWIAVIHLGSLLAIHKSFPISRLKRIGENENFQGQPQSKNNSITLKLNIIPLKFESNMKFIRARIFRKL